MLINRRVIPLALMSALAMVSPLPSFSQDETPRHASENSGKVRASLSGVILCRGKTTAKRLKIRFDQKKKVLRLRIAGARAFVALDREGEVAAQGYDLCEILDWAQREGNFYLLLKIRGASRPYSPQSQCGAGEEENLIWLKLDRKLKRVDAHSELTESCWQDVEPTDEDPDFSPDFATNPVHIELMNYTHSQKYRLEYDRAHPEAGIVVTGR